MVEHVNQNESKSYGLEDVSQKLRNTEMRTLNHDQLLKNPDKGRAVVKLKIANAILIFQKGKK